MKAKISRGNSFRGVLNYALDEKKNIEIVGGNMSAETARDLSAEFSASRQLRPECRRPVWHCSLSLPAAEKLDNEKWSEIADNFLKKMKVENQQYVIIKHQDTEYDHVHIITSRIKMDGELWHGRNDVKKAIQATQELEKEYNLKITPGPGRPAFKKALSKNEIEMSLRTGQAPAKAVLQHTIDEVLSTNPTTQAFCEQLQAAGVKVRPNIAKTGRMSGFSFSYKNINFKGSSLGKKFTWNNLRKNGLNYDKDRDTAYLQQLKQKEVQNGKTATSTRTNTKTSEEHIRTDTRAQNSADRHSGEARREARTVSVSNVSAFRRDDRENTNAQRADGNDTNENAPGDVSSGAQHEERERESFERTAQLNFEHSRSSRRDRKDRNDAEKNQEQSTFKTDGNYADSNGNDVSGSVDRVLSLSSSVLAKSDKYKNSADSRSSEVSGQNKTSTEKNLSARNGKGGLMGHIEKKQRAWENQAQALCAEKYRITCMHPVKKTFVLGKRKNTDEKFYTRDEVKKLIPFLSAKNAQGYNIYVTPLSEKFHYILLDDTTYKKIEDLKYFGFSPALTQESSPKNFQAVFITKKTPGKNEQKIANSIVQRINQKFGDKRLSGVVHPFRLAGFANRKEKYNKNGKYPFVTLHSAKNHVDEKLNRELERTRKLYEETKAAQAQAKAKIQSEQRLKEIQTYTYEDEEPNNFKRAKTINNKFKREYAHQRNYALEAFDDPDESILDYRTVKALLHAGEKKEDIKQALLSCSPSILTRHTAFDDYADRTIQKAEDEVIKQKMREQQRTSKNENENEMEL